MGYGHHSAAWMFFKPIVFVIAVYVGSCLFWLAKKHVEECCAKKKKK